MVSVFSQKVLLKQYISFAPIDIRASIKNLAKERNFMFKISVKGA